MNDLIPNLVARLMPPVLGTHGKQRLSVLIYHRVLPDFDYMRPTEPTAQEFALQMELLARYFNPLSLEHALRLLDSGELPERAVAVTFDDGYADNEQVALPILKRWGVPATVFVATGFLNGGQMWNDTVIESIRSFQGDELGLEDIGLGRHLLVEQSERKSLAEDILRTIKHWNPDDRSSAVNLIASRCSPPKGELMLTTSQLKDLHNAGVEIGAHTVNHPILAAVSQEVALEEIERSKLKLEEILGSRVRFFAYPNGLPDRDYLPCHRDAVKEIGFESALSTHWGVVSKSSDRWQLPRFTPWDRTPLRFITRLLLNYRNPA